MTYYEAKTGAGKKYWVESPETKYVVVVYHYFKRGTRWFLSYDGEKLRRTKARWVKRTAPDIYHLIKDNSGLGTYNIL